MRQAQSEWVRPNRDLTVEDGFGHEVPRLLQGASPGRWRRQERHQCCPFSIGQVSHVVAEVRCAHGSLGRES